MKQRNLKKKVGALLLAATMTVNLFPALGGEVYAAELPDNTQFATVEELKAFNTNDNDGATNPAKVYFGDNNQQWWIAGSQNNDSMTLFAASPLVQNVKFYRDFSDHEYSFEANTGYGGTAGRKTVYANHYGASDIRGTIKALETDENYFSAQEQNMMVETTFYTKDTRNTVNYALTDKLYLVYAKGIGVSHVLVGANSGNNLDTGLIVSSAYWTDVSDFWTRSASDNYIDALVWWRNKQIGYGSVNNVDKPILPAFQLNLSSILFASAAPAAAADGQMTISTDGKRNIFTLRHSASNLGSARVAHDYTKVDVTGVPSGSYLVAQNRDGAWAKAVSGTTSVSASNMRIDSFENCRVWLETTDSSERKTYAAMATQEAGYTVNVTGNSTLNITSNNAVQRVKIGNAIVDITIEAESGYMFPADYSVAGQNGITVTRNSSSRITVSGIPTADVSLTLPAATPAVYGMDLSGNGIFGSACVGYASDKVTAQEFTITNTGNVDLTNVQITITGTDSGAFVLTGDNTVMSIQPNGTIKVTVKPEDNLAVKEYQAQLSVSADNCNTASKTLQFEVTNHAYNDVVTPPTCTQKGYTTHTCQNCGDSYTDNKIDEIPHSFGDWEPIQAPTCEQSGSRRHVCTVCKYTETENLNPNGHEWEDTPTVDGEPTCQNDGSQSIHCKNCNATKDSQTIPRVDHKYTNYISNHDATCTKDGTKTAACDYGCGNTDTLPDDGSMLEHDYEWTYNNDAACEKNGTETGVCKDCGDKTTREKAGTALEHQPGGWIIDKEATATTDGEKHKECTVCRKVLETETILATGTPGGRYKILEGADQTWKGSGSLTIKANGNISKFTGIKVDGVAVDSSNYEAKSGSTVVTLKESYLAGLSAGVHTLTFVYNDGEVSTRFMIADKETSGTPEIPDNSTKDNQNTGNRTDTGSRRSPQTGDKTNINLYLLLLLMSGLMIAFCVEWKKIKSKC